MRKSVSIISVLLCCTLIASIFTCMVSVSDEQLKIWLASDTHFVPSALCGNVGDSQNVPSSDLYHHATTQGQMTFESEAIIRSFLGSFSNSDTDYLLISGDLTNGSESSHEQFADLLRETEQKTGKHVFVTPGNHDITQPSSSSTIIDYKTFKTIYSEFGYDEALVVDEDSCSYTADLGDKHRLISLDSCDYGKDNGILSRQKIKWLFEQLDAANDDGKVPVLMMHHSLLKHYAVQPMMKINGYTHATFADKLASLGIKYCFTGHIHGNDISSKAGLINKTTIYDIMTGSLITSPNSYREITFNADKTRIDTKYIEKIDVAFLPDGYTSAQLRMLRNNFPSFAKGYFKEGMSYWVNKNIGGPRLFAKLLGIKSGTRAYDKIEEITSLFSKALALPIYGESNSLEAVAAAGKMTMPDSGYSKVYEIIAGVTESFYSGEFQGEAHTEELKLLSVSVKSALAYSYALNNLDDPEDIDNLTDKERVKFDFDIKVSSFIINHLLLPDFMITLLAVPLLKGIINDYSAPTDLKVDL